MQIGDKVGYSTAFLKSVCLPRTGDFQKFIPGNTFDMRRVGKIVKFGTGGFVVVEWDDGNSDLMAVSNIEKIGVI